MSILKVARLGNPVLRMTAEPLTKSQIRSADTQRMIDDMLETMHEHDGVGLAAPQVHFGARLAVIELPPEKDATPNPPLILINPVITPLDAERVTDWEGCLSIPDLRGLVPRARRVGVEALDRQARSQVFEAADYRARVIQHECDHLDGVVYLDRMADLRSLSFLREFRHYVDQDADLDEE
jgi:peptide deformylase